MINNKFLVIGWDEEVQEYRHPDIIYSSIDQKDEYYKVNGGDSGLNDSKKLAIRAYNHHYRDDHVTGIVIGKFKYDYKTGFTTDIEETYNGFSLEQVKEWYSECWDAGIGGQIGNLATNWELSDLSVDDNFISVEDYMPEDLCLCLFGGPGKSFTKDCICKFDDGTLKFSHRTIIDPNDENEKIKWIEEWSKRQLKNATTMYKGCGGVGPAYHWEMTKEWADRVVAWRWFKEGEKIYQYM